MKYKYDSLKPELNLLVDLVPIDMLVVDVRTPKSTMEYLVLKNKYNFRIPFTSIDFAVQPNFTAVLIQLYPCSVDILCKWNQMFKHLGLVESTILDILNTSETLLERRDLITQLDYYLIQTEPFSHYTNILKTAYINHDFRNLSHSVNQKPFIAQDKNIGIKWDREWLVYKATT